MKAKIASSSLLLLAVLVLLLQSQPPIPASGNTVSWLHTAGIYIYNQGGQRVNPIGINYQYSQGESLSLSDLQTAQVLGFNAFRVNDVYWGLLQPHNESAKGIDSQYFVTGKSPGHTSMVPLDTVVNMAVQANMYVIICMGAWSGWYVPPSWAFPSISHIGNNAVWGHESSATMQAYSSLISGTAAKERTGIINTWRFIADRYKNVPNVMFELLNEPIVSDSSLAGVSYKSLNEAIISAIESVETQPHLKIIELLRDQYDNEIIQGASDVGKSNVVWANHLYAPIPYNPTGSYRHDAFTWHGRSLPAGNGNGTTYVAWKLIRVASLIHGWTRPWMNTEFSKRISETYWSDWFKIVMDTMEEQHHSSWQYFCYSSDTQKQVGWNIADPVVKQQMMPMLEPYISPAGDTTTTTSSSSSSTTLSTSSRTMSTTSTASSSTAVTSSTTSTFTSNTATTISANSTVTTPVTSSTQTSSTPTTTIITSSSTTRTLVTTLSSSTSTVTTSTQASSPVQSTTSVSSAPQTSTSTSSSPVSSSTTSSTQASSTIQTTYTSTSTAQSSSSTTSVAGTVFVTVTVAPQTITQTVTQAQLIVSVTVTVGDPSVTTSLSPATTTPHRPCHESCEPAPTFDAFSILTLLLVAPFIPRLAYVAAGRKFPPFF